MMVLDDWLVIVQLAAAAEYAEIPDELEAAMILWEFTPFRAAPPTTIVGYLRGFFSVGLASEWYEMLGFEEPLGPRVVDTPPL